MHPDGREIPSKNNNNNNCGLKLVLLYHQTLDLNMFLRALKLKLNMIISNDLSQNTVC